MHDDQTENLKNANKSSSHRQNSTQTDTSNLEHPLLLTEKLKIELDFQFSNSILKVFKLDYTEFNAHSILQPTLIKMGSNLWELVYARPQVCETGRY